MEFLCSHVDSQFLYGILVFFLYACVCARVCVDSLLDECVQLGGNPSVMSIGLAQNYGLNSFPFRIDENSSKKL